MPETPPLEELGDPPIVEVIAGVWLESLPELDPILLGGYWLSRRDEWPKKRLAPAIEAPTIRFHTGVPPMRIWLMSEDETYVLQVQHDRFYLNWRRRGIHYPRFSRHGGLRDRALSELAHLRAFCERQMGRPPVPTHVEVGKVDHVPWIGADDMASMIPSAAPVLRLLSSDPANVTIRVDDGVPTRGSRLQVGTVATLDEAGNEARTLRIETTVVRPVGEGGDAVGRALDDAGKETNLIFDRLIPKDERQKRFGGTR